LQVAKLLDPSTGDVEIRILGGTDKGCQSQSLYADQKTLAASSEFFAACTSAPSTNANMKAFSDEWNQSGRAKKKRRSTTACRKVIDFNDFDFNTMHNLIYFIYTGKANMDLNIETEVPTSPKSRQTGPVTPEPCHPFALFKAANMFLLPDLERMAEAYLVRTCCVENICERLFNFDLKPHDALGRKYIEYLRKWRVFDAVRKQPGFEAMVRSLTDDPESAFRKEILVALLEEVGLR
jgi:BTB/POZ domain